MIITVMVEMMLMGLKWFRMGIKAWTRSALYYEDPLRWVMAYAFGMFALESMGFGVTACVGGCYIIDSWDVITSHSKI